jgi:hypothetical protein
MSAALDVKKLAPPQRPRTRHRIIGDPRTKDLHRGVGVDHPHCVVDDHSRLAYVELHAREDADTNIHTLERALRFFAELALDVVDPLHVAEMTAAERALLVTTSHTPVGMNKGQVLRELPSRWMVIGDSVVRAVSSSCLRRQNCDSGQRVSSA